VRSPGDGQDVRVGEAVSVFGHEPCAADDLQSENDNGRLALCRGVRLTSTAKVAEAAAAAHNRTRREQGGGFEGLFQPLAAGGHGRWWTRTGAQ
jgi:hypothetical protein